MRRGLPYTCYTSLLWQQRVHFILQTLHMLWYSFSNPSIGLPQTNVVNSSVPLLAFYGPDWNQHFFLNGVPSQPSTFRPLLDIFLLKVNLGYFFSSNFTCFCISVSSVQSHGLNLMLNPGNVLIWLSPSFGLCNPLPSPQLLPVHLLLIMIFIFQNSGRVSHLLLTEHSSHSQNPHQIHVSFFCLICVPLSLRWSTYLPLYPLPASLPHAAPLPQALSGPHIQTGFYSWEGRATPQSPLCGLRTLKTNKKH